MLPKYSLTFKQFKLFLYINFEKCECALLYELLNEKHQKHACPFFHFLLTFNGMDHLELNSSYQKHREIKTWVFLISFTKKAQFQYSEHAIWIQIPTNGFCNRISWRHLFPINSGKSKHRGSSGNFPKRSSIWTTEYCKISATACCHFDLDVSLSLLSHSLCTICVSCLSEFHWSECPFHTAK